MPPMILPHLDHRSQNVVPCFLFHHHVVREHAAVPADVFEFLRHFAGVVAHPITGVAGDV